MGNSVDVRDSLFFLEKDRKNNMGITFAENEIMV